MAKIPDGLIKEPLAGLELVRRGKVRDTYRLQDESKLLVVASDRISIFDFVLNALVPQKGAVLTAMNSFWRTEVMRDQFAHDLVASGAEIDAHLPEALRGNPELQARAAVVRKLDMLSCEAIVRGCLTGTGFRDYRKDGAVCGHRLPADLSDGDRLFCPLFTPSTKAEVGHDENITADSVAEKWGVHPERIALQMFALAADFARKRGIVLADTKLELGRDSSGRLAVGDEVFTPDSSRFWDEREWVAAQAKHPRVSPGGFDKQFVREWGKKNGISGTLDAADPGIIAEVQAKVVPSEVLERTTLLYRYIFWRLTGRKLESYQRERMGIAVQPPKLRVEVLSGSESDVPQMMQGLAFLEKAQAHGEITARRHVISCHRNPGALSDYASGLRETAESNTVVIAGAGMAAQLPGVLKALLRPDIPVIGVAFAGKDEEANQAARLSMEQLPGQPIALRSDGRAYFGSEGFLAACKAALDDEFLPVAFGSKPAQIDAPLMP